MKWNAENEEKRGEEGIHGAVTRARAQLIEQRGHEVWLGSTTPELDQWLHEKLRPNKNTLFSVRYVVRVACCACCVSRVASSDVAAAAAAVAGSCSRGAYLVE
jgi:hypothetical protein